MRLLICGDRNWNDATYLEAKLDAFAEHHSITHVIEGEARGADTLGRLWAEKHNILVLRFPALWSKFGKAAGPMRNQQMLDEGKPDYVLAFHEHIEQSKGTGDMVRRARAAKILVEVYNAT